MQILGAIFIIVGFIISHFLSRKVINYISADSNIYMQEVILKTQQSISLLNWITLLICSIFISIYAWQGQQLYLTIIVVVICINIYNKVLKYALIIQSYRNPFLLTLLGFHNMVVLRDTKSEDRPDSNNY